MIDTPNPSRDASNKEDRDDRYFWFWWVVATTVGVVLGTSVGAMIEEASTQSWYLVGTPRPEEILTSLITVGGAYSALGAVVGLTQWTVLRRRLNQVGWWAPATIVGWSLAGVVGRALSAVLRDLTPAVGDEWAVDLAAYFMSVMLLAGVFQWLVLRRQVNGASRWLWGSVGALLVALVAAEAVVAGIVSAGWLRWEDLASVQGWVYYGLVIGPIYGAITGIVMVRLLRQRKGADAAASTVASSSWSANVRT
jgi:hypothetical protein